ncbi:acyl-CoA N-acyltransferase [Thozetella sp. PMI_491]|nr:acyl-CoA N-acyltransferase [Thozetella sp. PMI_491]
MTPGDIPGLMRVADEVHPGLPESADVFAERVRLFPSGCLVLVDDDALCGYAVSHPIRRNQPPPLDSLLGEIAPDADQYYIHDLAILPKARGDGRAAEGIAELFEVAKCYSTTCLISVYGTTSFWGRFGFVPVPVDEAFSQKLSSYGDDAIFLLRQRVENTTLGPAEQP